MNEFDFLLNRRIEISFKEKIGDETKNHHAKGYVPYIKYGGTGGAKIYLIQDDGFVGWFYPEKKNISYLDLKILDWDPGAKEEVSREELIDLEE